MRRRHILASTGAVLVTGALLAGCGNDDAETRNAIASTVAEDIDDSEPQTAAQSDGITPEQIAGMRAATAKYVTDSNAALDAGYQQFTQMVDGVGVLYYNSKLPAGFDPNQPQLLSYTGQGDAGQLAAVGWAFTEQPAEPPLPGATYGTFPAACHYSDGSYVEQQDKDACQDASPPEGTSFTFWHPELTTMYAWVWFPNPDGVLAPTNSLLTASSQASAAPTAPTTATPSATPSASTTPTPSATPTESNGD
jgi:hypothetical protein